MAIGLDIGGDRIRAAVVRDSLDDLLTLLGDASRASGAGRQEWVIDDLHIGSAVLAVAGDEERPVTELLSAGLEALSLAAEIPVAWTRRMVEKIRDLGQRIGHGGATRVVVTGLAPAGISLTPEIVANATQALGAAAVSYGEFQGAVDRWSERRGHEIGLDTDCEGAVTTTYSANLAERVRREAIGQRIEAWGLVERDAAGRVIRLRMDDFEVLAPRAAIPIAELAGVFGTPDGEPWFDLSDWLESRGD